MNRRRFLAGTSALTVASLGLYMQTSEDRISDLEANVQKLDGRVSVLETQIANIPHDASLPAPESPTTEDEEAPAALTVEGVGTTVSDKFALEPERYRVDATITGISDFSGFIVYLLGPSGTEDLLFNEIIEGGGTWEGSVTTTVVEGGQYFVEVSNTDAAWQLTFSQF